MSKGWIKNLKKNKGPRDLESIKKEYSELLAKSGQSQYQSYVQELELAQLNKRMLEVNNEASERMRLDKENAPKPETK